MHIMILVYHLVSFWMCLSMDTSASFKTSLPCTSNFMDWIWPSSFLHSKPAGIKMCVCVIFPSDVDVLLCKSEGAEDATCQTELLINGFPGQGRIRETSALSASWCTLWLGFRFASCMHAVHGHVHENFSDNHRPARALLDCWLGVGGATASCCRFCSWSRTRAMGSGACTVLTAGSAMDITRTALRGSKLVCMDISFSCCHNSFSSISTDTR